ncbi:hypothetical protein TIFTF001_035101 [Ficus carica]|uniref:Uncharacterized protein n=1 Tax=Ficus carica TaxID=3494 RepID=A0AA88E9K5_FICCA|nr:hypothetical protein TIFTF001_035101 [Ficus carica]
MPRRHPFSLILPPTPPPPPSPLSHSPITLNATLPSLSPFSTVAAAAALSSYQGCEKSNVTLLLNFLFSNKNTNTQFLSNFLGV